MTAAIFLYVIMGLIAGYFSARLYKTMKGREWKRAAFLVSVNNCAFIVYEPLIIFNCVIIKILSLNIFCLVILLALKKCAVV